MKAKILAMLRNADGYLSGELISSRLEITRSAVWKNVKSLRAQGYQIDSVRNLGYRLINAGNVINRTELRNMLDANELLRPLNMEYSPEIDSTNLAARRASETISKGWTLFVADRQTAGRGRLGRQWQSPSGGLWFSLLFQPDQGFTVPANLTLLAGLNVQQALTRLTGLKVLIKWPNDLVVMPSGKKICGILTEAVLEDMQTKAVIIGIGINANQIGFNQEISAIASSLRIETGEIIDRIALLQAVLVELIGSFQMYLAGDQHEMTAWLAEYKRWCVTIGREVEIRHPDQSVSRGLAVDLSREGDLIVETSDGRRINCHAGEVSVRGLLGYI